MIMRLLAVLACFAAILPLAPIPAAAQSSAQRIVAIGDLHGDYAAWRAIAQAAKIMDRGGRWIGGRTTLVQTGDIVDRGPDSLRIIEDLMRLQRQAPRRGGRVIVLPGNHEAMMMTGDLRYVHPGEYRAFVTGQSARLREAAYESQRTQIEAAARARDPNLSPQAIKAAWMAQVPLGMIEHQRAWSPQGRLGGWTIGNPAVARIGDTLFVHGGISAGYADLPIEEINRRVAAALTARDMMPESIINDPMGPLWYRGLVAREASEKNEPPVGSVSRIASPQRPTVEQELDRALKAFQVRQMVIGHTPHLKGIAVAHDGRLVNIDTGISSAYGGTPSYLEILGDRLIPHTVSRPPATAASRR